MLFRNDFRVADPQSKNTTRRKILIIHSCGRLSRVGAGFPLYEACPRGIFFLPELAKYGILSPSGGPMG
ncbi:hypothetical protein PGT21_007530 [Puccinia graminis f. sp. tritici]|uniref:Uncharacterized protein n=1 Tax=Puccinia graminis f. sp. tritici TaxID=56615 RepID=A0A5B0NBV8_PUCGR|nr:hypothetical protein PGT21_008558 [Puccinia graminis f. sp. tritici]KAA1085448.1 hypothetical protein PGT21_007530 [Puccinia graminis f. sp. tritici]KAA1122948.1 hypothetical protein PGTUg99_005875 [Puccinia graminis f. sp. tritici]